MATQPYRPALNHQLRIQKIAVLTDFSRNSDTAIRYAAAVARAYKADIILAHAYLPPYFAYAEPDAASTYQSLQAIRQGLENRLIGQTEAIYLQDIKCKTLLWEGTPGELPTELRDLDLIVVGTSGDTGFKKAALGSTAETIFRSSIVPVLTVGPHCKCSGAKEAGFETILYATDFSAGSGVAFPYALSLAHEHSAELILLHVMSDKDAGFSFEQTMAREKPLQKLHCLMPERSELACKPRYLVDFGRADEVIVREARNWKVDIIVIGARGAGALASAVSHFGGGTAYKVAVNAECPVLTVRRP